MDDQNCVTGYLRSALEPKKLKRTVEDIVKILNHIGMDSFDAIAFRGISGCLVAPTVSYVTGKPMIVVRKKGDGSHSSFRVEGFIDAKRIVIIDDLVQSGETMDNLVWDLNNNRSVPLGKVVAIILYTDWNSYEKNLIKYQIKERTAEYLSDVPVYSFKYEYSEVKDRYRYYFSEPMREIFPDLPFKNKDGCYEEQPLVDI